MPNSGTQACCSTICAATEALSKWQSSIMLNANSPTARINAAGRTNERGSTNTTRAKTSGRNIIADSNMLLPHQKENHASYSERDVKCVLLNVSSLESSC